MDHLATKSIERLFNAIVRLGTPEECRNFFEDLCTIKEIRDMAQRLDVALLLNAKESYQDISEKTKVSSTTISRVNRCLNYGKGGYQSAIEKMTPEEREEK